MNCIKSLYIIFYAKNQKQNQTLFIQNVSAPSDKNVSHMAIYLNTPILYTTENHYLDPFGLPLMSCEVELDLMLTIDCVLVDNRNNIIEVSFMITSTKNYALVINFSIRDNLEPLENLK